MRRIAFSSRTTTMAKVIVRVALTATVMQLGKKRKKKRTMEWLLAWLPITMKLKKKRIRLMLVINPGPSR